MARPKSEILLAAVCWAAVAGMAAFIAPWVFFYGIAPVFAYYPVLAYLIVSVLIVMFLHYVLRRVRVWRTKRADVEPTDSRGAI